MEHYGDEVLSQFMDRDLSAQEQESVATHLTVCPDCRAALDQLTTLTAAARQLPVPEPPDRIWHRIRERTGYGMPRRRTTPGLAWLGIPALAAAAALLVAVFPRQPATSRLALETPAQPARSEIPPAPVAHLSSAVPTHQADSRRQVAADAVRTAAPQDSVVQTLSGRTVILQPGQVLREYLGVAQQAVNDAGTAMIENPGNPRVRLVYSSSRQFQAETVELLTGGGE